MTLRSPRTWLFLLLVIALGVTLYLSDRTSLWRGDLLTSVQPTIVKKNGFEIHLITLDEPTDAATLTPSTVYLVTVKPSFGSFGQPLDRLFHEPSVSYYGYMYTPGKSGELEGQAATAFLEQFPGTFFASDAARMHDDAGDHILSAFEAAHSVVLQGTDTPETDVAIGDRTYLLVVMNGVATLQKPATLLTCGNGVIDPAEQCDDGNEIDIDDCTNECRTAICGDGICSADEGTQCNPDVGACTGNFVCVQDCTNILCGNGTVDPGEECDDGNEVPDDSCSNECHTTFCGIESCSSSSSISASNSSSVATLCGNGTVDPGEECDDGNQISYDGCNATCHTVPCDCPPNADCVCVQPSSSSSVSACTEADCGIAPGTPNTTCPDGSLAGPVCQRNNAGECAWDVIECPSTSSSEPSITSSSGGGAPSCGDGVCNGGESAIACTPPLEQPDVCDGHIYCPQDCSGEPQS